MLLFELNCELLTPIEHTGTSDVCDFLLMESRDFNLRGGIVLYQEAYVSSYAFSQVFWLGKAIMNSENSVFPVQIFRRTLRFK